MGNRKGRRSKLPQLNIATIFYDSLKVTQLRPFLRTLSFFSKFASLPICTILLLPPLPPNKYIFVFRRILSQLSLFVSKYQLFSTKFYSTQNHWKLKKMNFVLKFQSHSMLLCNQSLFLGFDWDFRSCQESACKIFPKFDRIDENCSPFLFKMLIKTGQLLQFEFSS